MKPSSCVALVAVIGMAILIGCTEVTPVPKPEPTPVPPQDEPAPQEEPKIEDLVVPDVFLGVWINDGHKLIVTRTKIKYRYSDVVVAEFFSYNSEDVVVISSPADYIARYFIRGVGDQKDSPSLTLTMFDDDPDTRLRMYVNALENFMFLYKEAPEPTPAPPQAPAAPQDEPTEVLVVPDSFLGVWIKDEHELIVTRARIEYRRSGDTIAELFPHNSEDAALHPPAATFVDRYVIRGTGDDKTALYLSQLLTETDPPLLRCIIDVIDDDNPVIVFDKARE